MQAEFATAVVLLIAGIIRPSIMKGSFYIMFSLTRLQELLRNAWDPRANLRICALLVVDAKYNSFWVLLLDILGIVHTLLYPTKIQDTTSWNYIFTTVA